jgi:hypothetical protein
MQERQLNVWIDVNLKLALAELARSQGKTVKELVADILSRGVATQHSEIVERHFLPEIRRVIRAEVHEANEELLTEVCEYLQSHILAEVKAFFRRNSG